MPPKKKTAKAPSSGTRSTKRASAAKKVAAPAVTPKPAKQATATTAVKKTTTKRGAPPPASSPSTPDFSSLTVAQLKAECTKNGLEATGTKAVLIKRLNDNVQNGGGDDNGPPAKLQKQSTIQRALESMKAMAAADSRIMKPRSMKVDQYCSLPNAQVLDDYSCMLNQTNIGFNNNKYYVIQVIKSNNSYYAFNRWGRVGEPGSQATKGPFTDSKKAIADFEQKFRDKTKNVWKERADFEAVPGKYTLLDIGDDDDDAGQCSRVVKCVDGTTGVLAAYKPCTLDVATQCLVKLVFDNDMFREALIKLEIDVKKMPLGKLSKTQIVKGFEVLDDLKTLLDGKSQSKKLEELSSKFYTVIPHDFGRQRPPIINTHELLRTKLDMLITLGDIEQAQEMLHNKGDVVSETGELFDHPLDYQYKLLQCCLNLMKVGEQEFKILEKYLQSTGGGYRVKKILNIWQIDRKGESDRVKPHDKISNRKLLWHGTNVAVVAAILKSGLRIMPHSGGRVGKGIYFASENSKSAGYVQTSKNIGIMFLNEVILGKEHHISRDDPRLTKPPPGFDSIVARGQTEPDPKFDTTLKLEGKSVIVPQGKPIRQPQYQSSSFSQSEYLVYQENQVRMRYMLQLQMDY